MLVLPIRGVTNRRIAFRRGKVARSATINDVAKKAGVSIKTVSRVVNREANVREKTREKVMSAINALDYRPNQAARGLAGNRSYLMGLLYDNPSPSYLANLQAGVLGACSAAGYGLALCPVSFAAADMDATVEAWLKHTGVDGVILTPPLSDSMPLLARLQALGVPAVVVSSPGAKGAVAVPAVMIDEEEAARQVTAHLIEAGHKTIGFIKGHPDHYASAHRYAGFLAAMGEAGLTPEPAHIKGGRFDFASGETAGDALLAMRGRPTAIFASNDDMAAGVMHVAHRLGLDIPRDLAVVGFDDTPLSRQIWPTLTTIRQPIRQIGERAAEILMARLGGSKKTEGSALHQLDFELKVRGSSAAKATSSPNAGPSIRSL